MERSVQYVKRRLQGERIVVKRRRMTTTTATTGNVQRWKEEKDGQRVVVRRLDYGVVVVRWTGLDWIGNRIEYWIRGNFTGRRCTSEAGGGKKSRIEG